MTATFIYIKILYSYVPETLFDRIMNIEAIKHFLFWQKNLQLAIQNYEFL